MAALQVQKVLDSIDFKNERREFVRLQPMRLKDCGRRLVNIRFSGGTVIGLRVAYFARNCDQKKASKKRCKSLYPGLYLLGIHDRCTPGLASEIAVASAALDSFEETRHMLANHGCMLKIKTIHHLVKRFAARAQLAQQDDRSDWSEDAASVQGRRVVVSTDEGRRAIAL
jgi:hypothetical protein